MTQAEFFFVPRASWPFEGFERAATRGCGPAMRRGRCRAADAPRCGPAAKRDVARSDERRMMLDVRETPEELMIQADVPGVTKDLVVIETLDGKLHLSVTPAAAPDAAGDTSKPADNAEAAAPSEKAAEETAAPESPRSASGAQKRPHGADVKWHRQEISRRYGKRVIKLPENVDVENITASLELGVLTVKIPLVELAPKSKRVVVA